MVDRKKILWRGTMTRKKAGHLTLPFGGKRFVKEKEDNFA
jgi:hypothetical protein